MSESSVLDRCDQDTHGDRNTIHHVAQDCEWLCDRVNVGIERAMNRDAQFAREVAIFTNTYHGMTNVWNQTAYSVVTNSIRTGHMVVSTIIDTANTIANTRQNNDK